MSWHGSRRRIPLTSTKNWRLGVVLVAVSWIAGASASVAMAETSPCEDKAATATSKTDGVPRLIRERVDRSVRQAAALSRFDRSDEAIAKLDALVAFLDGARGARVKDRARAELTTSIDALKRCLAAARPAPLTWATISVFEETAEGGRGRPAGAGVFLDVEGIPIGRSGPDGTLEAKLPSGTIQIEATEYPSSWGTEVVTLSPGEPHAVSIVMATDKEPSEDSDLVLEEASDEILPANPASVTLKFVQDDDPVTIEEIEEVRVSDDPDTFGEDLERYFTVTRGMMRATDVAAVYQHMARNSKIGQPLSIAARAIDTAGRAHYGTLGFYLGRFKLAVTLAPPPSNPALPVSNIAVRVSIIGSDVTMTRVSDANGRFEIESLPDATIMIEAHITTSDNYYYANAPVTLCGDTAATVLMLNVKDMVAGVRGVVIDARTSPCAAVPRR
jgi:hypothetical protein